MPPGCSSHGKLQNCISRGPRMRMNKVSFFGAARIVRKIRESKCEKDPLQKHGGSLDTVSQTLRVKERQGLEVQPPSVFVYCIVQ
ncbi:unnamed protein product [Fusarium graminearum]|nr:unnamed protein product [Fusarium graminearum]